jgi:hypothetical protein
LGDKRTGRGSAATSHGDPISDMDPTKAYFI